MNFPTLDDLGVFAGRLAATETLPTATGPVLVQTAPWAQQTGPRVGPIRIAAPAMQPAVVSPASVPHDASAMVSLPMPALQTTGPLPMTIRPPSTSTEQAMMLREQAMREAEQAARLSRYETEALLRASAAEREAMMRMMAEQRAAAVEARLRAVEAQMAPTVSPLPAEAKPEEKGTPWGLIVGAIVGTYALTRGGGA